MSITDVGQLFIKIHGIPRSNTLALRRHRHRFMELLMRTASNVGPQMTDLRSDGQRRHFINERFARLISIANRLDSKSQIQAFVALLTDTVWAFEHTIDEHQKRVAEGSLKVARELQGRGIEVDRRGLWLAARLHDFGKIGWPKEFLDKPPPLSPQDSLLIETHLYLGLFLLKEIGFARAAAGILSFNHVYDGYPFVDDVRNMPVEGQILSAVDCFDALTSPRSYRGGQKSRPIEAYEQLAERAYSPGVLGAVFETLV